MPGKPPIEFDQLAVFIAVAETGSFSKAAARLGVGKGTVSRTIARLEDQLGAEILHRNTRRVALSTAGAELLERTAGPLAALQEAISDIADRDAEPAGELRIAAPHDFGLITLPALLSEFLRRYPRIRADVRLANDKADLVAGGFDVAFRVAMGQQQDSTLTVRRLAGGAAACFAAPGYLARRGRPSYLGDPSHAWLVHRALRELFAFPEGAVPYVTSDDFLFLRELLRAEAGVGLMPSFVAASLVADGALAPVEIKGSLPPGGNLVLVYPSSGRVSKKVTAFRDFSVTWLRQRPMG